MRLNYFTSRISYSRTRPALALRPHRPGIADQARAIGELMEILPSFKSAFVVADDLVADFLPDSIVFQFHGRAEHHVAFRIQQFGIDDLPRWTA